MNRTATQGAAGSTAAGRVPLVSESIRRHREAVGFDTATLRRVNVVKRLVRFLAIFG